MECKLQVRQSMSIQSWPQLHVLFISVSFVALVYVSRAGAELIKSNHDKDEFQTPATAGPIPNYRHVPARDTPSRLSPHPSKSSNGSSSEETLKNLVTFSNLNSQLSTPQPSSRLKRSYISDDQTVQQQPKARIKIHRHRLRHEQKQNKAIIMNTTNSGNDGGSRTCSFGDCVNNSGPSNPKKTSLLQPQEKCYHTGDVLVVVAITCLLNFSFVLVLWASVRWINYHPKRSSSSWRKNKCDNKGRRFGYRRKKWNSEGNCCCWDDMSRSDSSSSSEDEQYDEGRIDQAQDNLIVKSYSMEELRFYHG